MRLVTASLALFERPIVLPCSCVPSELLAVVRERNARKRESRGQASLATQILQIFNFGTRGEIVCQIVVHAQQ